MRDQTDSSVIFAFYFFCDLLHWVSSAEASLSLLCDPLAKHPAHTSPYTNQSVPSFPSLLIPSRTPLVYYPLPRLYSSSSLRLLTRFRCLSSLVPYSLHLYHLHCLKLDLLVLSFHVLYFYFSISFFLPSSLAFPE